MNSPPIDWDQMKARDDALDRKLRDIASAFELSKKVADIENEVGHVKREVADIRDRMATSVELEAANENVRKMADGYATMQRRLDKVAELLTRHIIGRWPFQERFSNCRIYESTNLRIVGGGNPSLRNFVDSKMALFVRFRDGHRARTVPGTGSHWRRLS